MNNCKVSVVTVLFSSAVVVCALVFILRNHHVRLSDAGTNVAALESNSAAGIRESVCEAEGEVDKIKLRLQHKQDEIDELKSRHNALYGVEYVEGEIGTEDLPRVVFRDASEVVLSVGRPIIDLDHETSVFCSGNVVEVNRAWNELPSVGSECTIFSDREQCNACETGYAPHTPRHIRSYPSIYIGHVLNASPHSLTLSWLR